MSGADDVKAAVSVAHEVIQIARENPDAREAGRNAAKALVTVSRTVNVLLLPLVVVNAAYKRASDYFEHKQFERELGDKTASIPEKDLSEPPLSIAGPVLQAIIFVVDEAKLRELYVQLLATAMDGRVEGRAHPSFVEILKQISPEEIELLGNLLRLDSSVAVSEVRYVDPTGQTWITALRHQMQLEDDETHEPVFESKIASWVDNWIRLGLFNVTYTSYVTGEGLYEWINESPQFKGAANDAPDEWLTTSVKGILSATDFGKDFAVAVGIRSPEPSDRIISAER